MLNVTKMSDREILEQLLVNQVSLMQQVHRFKEFMAKKYKNEFSENLLNKDEIFKDMIEHSDDFWRQHNSLNEK